jgi:hypothetical protein
MPQRHVCQQPSTPVLRPLLLPHTGTAALLLALNLACGSDGTRVDADMRNAGLRASPAPAAQGPGTAEGSGTPAAPGTAVAPGTEEGAASGVPASANEASPGSLPIASPMPGADGPSVAGPGSEPPAGEHDFCRPAPTGPIPAFPGAEGFGAFARGGRDGDVYHVTNLASSGAGSFANGIQNVPAAGRTIVFDVSGYASISGTLSATAGRLTVAGQTAPGAGFGLKDGTFLLSAGDAVIRHIRFRDGLSGDAVDMDSNAINFIWDHCDMLFSHDENMSSFKAPPDQMTFGYSINAWGLQTHSAGGLWDQGMATSHHSLWAHNSERNPKARALLLDWVNNVTFDWDFGFTMGFSTSPAFWQANVLDNYFVSGTPKTSAMELAMLDRDGNPNFHLFVEGSLLDGNVNGVLDVTRRDFEAATGDYERLAAAVPLTANFQPPSASNPIVGLPVTRDDALTAYKRVVSTVGPLRLDVRSNEPLRDEVDALLIEDLLAQRRRHLTYQQIAATGIGNNGFGTLSSKPAPLDTDQDGMPDYWERAVGLDARVDDHAERVPDCTFAFVPANSGYTWLEDYLQFLAIPHGVVAGSVVAGSVAGGALARDTQLDVDMARFTSGLVPGAAFRVANAIQGTVAVLPDGHTARFTPAVGYLGRAGFSFAGTDSEGSTIRQDVGVLVAEAVPPG